VRKFRASVAFRFRHSQTSRGAWGWYVFVAFLLSVLALSLAVFALTQEKQRYNEQVVETALHVVRLFDQQISGSLDRIDMVFQHVAQTAILSLQQQKPDTVALSDVLRGEEKLLSGLRDIRIADASGQVRFGGRVPSRSVTDVAERRFFRLAQDDARSRLMINGPILLPRENKRVLLLARRLEFADGHFAGVVFAHLPCEYFRNILGAGLIGNHGMAEIRTEAMAAVYRVPDEYSEFSSQRISSVLDNALRVSRLSGGYLEKVQDGGTRYFAYRRIAQYPMYVLVGLSPDDYFGEGRKNIILTLSLTALLLIVIWISALLVIRAQARLREDIAQRVRMGNALELAILERGGLLNELASKNEALAQVNVTLEQKVTERTLALQQANMELEALARHDPLTHLKNRRCIDERLHEEFVRMKRSAQHYALLLVDIDHFKLVNDRYGHERGDMVLKKVSEIMSCSCRGSDFLGRYGGEEFVAILPDTPHGQALHVAEKIRCAVEKSPFPGVEGVTISIGLACSRLDDSDEWMAFRRADRNLYRAKGNGRNQVADDSPYLVSVRRPSEA